MRGLGLAAVVGMIFAGASVAQDRPAEAPEARLDRSVVDLGQVKIGSRVSAEVSIVNTGNAPLIVTEVMSGCGCMTALYPKNPLAPGGRGMIGVQLWIKTPGPFRHVAEVVYNGRGSEPTRLTVIGAGVE